MSPREVRASLGLAGIYGLRMLGLFLILPVFAVYAQTLPGGKNHALVGLALGAYGLTQALLQLPFGMASDRFGRKHVIAVGLLVFAAGSFIAAQSHDLVWIIVGRAVQGAGAVSAAVTALLADLTLDEHRTQAMAIIGGTIGLTFAFSLIAGPALYHAIGMAGIFTITGVLALAALAVLYRFVPDPEPRGLHAEAQASPAKLGAVVRDPQLLRLNFGIFALHAAQMAMFVVVPVALTQVSGMDVTRHWQVYLPILAASFVLMLPAIIYAEKRARTKPVFVASIALMLVAQIGFVPGVHSFTGIVIALGVYFVAFNVLEASLPSLVSKVAPVTAKGAALGVYNTSQSLGMFVGGAAGGLLAHVYGFAGVFLFAAALIGVWLGLALGMRAPLAVKTRMHRVGEVSAEHARLLSQKLSALRGVAEAVVVPAEGVAYLKVDRRGFDEEGVQRVIGGTKAWHQ